MDLAYRIGLDVDLRWVGTRIMNNSGVAAYVPAFCELATRIGWKLNDSVELSIAGQNLLHDHHPEYGVPGVQQGQIVRSVYAELSYHM
mgnify:CR=1 FL=1